jgi:hypothetical protein
MKTIVNEHELNHLLIPFLLSWVQDRQADNDGNCAKNYPLARGSGLWTPDNCIDKDPADNTDICYVDMARSPKSNHVEAGGAIYSDTEAGTYEGDAHCHGFAWADEPVSTSNRFKGNNLFYVSMYDHLRVRGYVQEVPGGKYFTNDDSLLLPSPNRKVVVFSLSVPPKKLNIFLEHLFFLFLIHQHQCVGVSNRCQLYPVRTVHRWK